MASKLFRRCMTIQHLNNPLPHDVCGMVIGKWKKPKWNQSTLLSQGRSLRINHTKARQFQQTKTLKVEMMTKVGLLIHGDEGEPPLKKKRCVNAKPVDHTYHDYTQVTDVDSVFEARASEQHKADGVAVVAANPRRKGLTTNFPAKLHKIVSDPRYNHIIRWQSHGRSWTVVDKELLASVESDARSKMYFSSLSFNRSGELTEYGCRILTSL
eukprot:scaffold2206_cov193-Alexandrium_tamarense.AAC.5